MNPGPYVKIPCLFQYSINALKYKGTNLNKLEGKGKNDMEHRRPRGFKRIKGEKYFKTYIIYGELLIFLWDH